MTANKNREQALRRTLNKAGYALRKSRANISLNNLGGYMIVDISTNAVVAGARFEMDLDDICDWVQDLS